MRVRRRSAPELSGNPPTPPTKNKKKYEFEHPTRRPRITLLCKRNRPWLRTERRGPNFNIILLYTVRCVCVCVLVKLARRGRFTFDPFRGWGEGGEGGGGQQQYTNIARPPPRSPLPTRPSVGAALGHANPFAGRHLTCTNNIILL